MSQENQNSAHEKTPGWPIIGGPRSHLDRAIKRLQVGRSYWIGSFGFLGAILAPFPFVFDPKLDGNGIFYGVPFSFCLGALIGMFVGRVLSFWMVVAGDYFEYCLAVENERTARNPWKIGTFCSMCHKECEPRDGCVVGDKFLCNECMIKEGDALPKKKSRTPTS